jgi:hypothetical protein
MQPSKVYNIHIHITVIFTFSIRLAFIFLLPIGLSLAVSLAYSDNDRAIKCGGDWQLTQDWMNELGNAGDFYC